MATVHIIGAGLAGLSAAVALAAKGTKVKLYEASAQAGGRCRSYHDPQLDCIIDNGNHLLLSANTAALSYLQAIGARDRLIEAERAIFPFVDLKTGERWQVEPSSGAIPWWIFKKERRIPGTVVADYLKGYRLVTAKSSERVADCVAPSGAMWSRFWEPLTVAALNTSPREASARLLGMVVRETFLKGESACRPLIARESLSHTLVQPALDWLERQGAEVILNRRLKTLIFNNDRVDELAFTDGPVKLEAGEPVVLAVPPSVAGSLVPDLAVPAESRPIVNAHIRLPADLSAPMMHRLPVPFLGMVGGAADWLFLRGDVISLTVSAAENLAAEANDTILGKLWKDTAKALELDENLQPKMRLIKEKRATFSQTPEALRRRPPAATRWQNLWLAGDWTDTGYPATIESAVRSGHIAAQQIKP